MSQTTTIEIRPRPQLREFLQSRKRWDCLVMHRRAGKTFASIQKLLVRALGDRRDGPPRRYAYVAPTRDQAKDIAWGYLKRFTWQIPGVETNESDLKVSFADATTIRLYSGDSYERLRGTYLDGVIIDEPEDISPDAWPSVIRPCLADYSGWAIWIGTIKGKKGLWQMLQAAATDPDWYAMLLRASESGIIPEAELADLRKNIHPDIYAQEFECDPQISRCLFTSAALAYQDEIAGKQRPEHGYLIHRADMDSVFWTPSSEEQAMTVVYERPRVGHSYLVSVDSASGADQTGGIDPDSHSILVHRAGYIDEFGEWHPPALAGRNIMVRGNKTGSMCCWWAQDVLEEQVFLLCRYYQAHLVPEINHDRGLIEAIRNRGGISIHYRKQFNHRENLTMNALGWRTDSDTRPKIIARLEVATREALRGDPSGGYEVRCPWILEQMRNFGTKPNGRQEALTDHDDDVISLAIGLFMIDAATCYRAKIVERQVPNDLKHLIGNSRQQGRQGRRNVG